MIYPAAVFKNFNAIGY